MEKIIRVKEMFETIKNTSSTNDKKRLLAEYGEDGLFIKLLEFTLNTYKVTGLSKKKMNKKLKLIPTVELNTMDEALEYILKNNTGRDEDIINIKSYIQSLPSDLQGFYTEIFMKSYKLGASKKLANSVFGSTFVDDFKVMKSTNYKDCKRDFDKKAKKDGYAIYLKENGVRGEIIVNNGKVKIRSRQGLYVEGFLDIENSFRNLPNGLYEGELTAIGSFKDSNERCRKTRSIYSSNGIKKGVKIGLFDYISLEDMIECKNNTPTTERKKFIENIAKNANSELIYYIEPIYIGSDLNMMDKILDDVTATKEEGISANILTAPYEFKKSKWAVKYKKFNTIDLKIIGMTEGDGKNKGKLGSMLVDYKGTPVGVGGWTGYERDYYWNNQDEYIGRVLEISYKDITTDTKTGKESLEFAQRVTMREIGKEVSYN
ncbi:DNA ligase [[Clostridium] sordellii]|uniref:ATP-dependent DNA ligase n=1 Tax=Paraclostridium sordellii TaxID=1505 RepID=UPI0005DB0B8D|nr:hypothetical protein [Paeniclostridium sordellii]CEQ01579.1 DNA ligase [[Clostridium] sordellii] [Paeniclostridium sordellii]